MYVYLQIPSLGFIVDGAYALTWGFERIFIRHFIPLGLFIFSRALIIYIVAHFLKIGKQKKERLYYFVN